MSIEIPTEMRNGMPIEMSIEMPIEMQFEMPILCQCQIVIIRLGNIFLKLSPYSENSSNFKCEFSEHFQEFYRHSNIDIGSKAPYCVCS